MEEVVSSGKFDLVVQGVGSRDAVENATIGYIDIGKG